MGRVASNISFLHFLENDYKNAEKYVDIAVNYDRYNAKALVNKGNCLYIRNDFMKAKENYLEAIGVEADCVEALYNLGYVNKKLNLFLEALQVSIILFRRWRSCRQSLPFQKLSFRSLIFMKLLVIPSKHSSGMRCC
jgi:tetratricopeptide (TPR) repeat protein